MMEFADDCVVSSATEPQPTSKSLTDFPEEIIYHILCFLDPLELIRLGTISKQFHAIANDRTVWRTVYKEARCARFPGPFPWQSTRFLQRTLVRSMQVERTWTSQSFRVKESSRRQILCDLEHNYDHHRDWVSLRFIFLGGPEEIMSRDIDTDSQQTLWNGGRVSRWTTCSIMCSKGHLVYLVLRLGNGDRHDTVKLLEFRANDDSGLLTGPVVFDVPAVCQEGNPYVRFTRAPEAPFVCIAVVASDRLDHVVVFDIRSQAFYKFPRFNSELVALQPHLMSWSPSFIRIFLTTTHIIVVSQKSPEGDVLEDGDGHPIHLIQAFVVPDSPILDNMGVCELRLSHETGGDGYQPLDFGIVRDSVVDSTDGSITSRFMHDSWSPPLLRSYCTEFSFPRSRSGAILPIYIKTHELFELETLNRVRLDDRAENEGIVRGFITLLTATASGWDPVLYKYAIDATGERCVAAHSGPGVPGPRSGFDSFHMGLIWFDGVGGRICYRTSGEEGAKLFIVELA